MNIDLDEILRLIGKFYDTCLIKSKKHSNKIIIECYRNGHNTDYLWYCLSDRKMIYGTGKIKKAIDYFILSDKTIENFICPL